MSSVTKVLALSFATLAAACGGGDEALPDAGTSADANDDSDGASGCTVTAWSSPDFDENAAGALALRDQLDALVGFMSDVELELAELTGPSDLTDLYEAGDPSLSGAITSNYDAIVGLAFDDFVALVANVGVDLMDDQDAWAPGADGGVWLTSGRGINAGGIEARQIVDKGLYTAVSYNYALSLTEGEITPATIDAFAAAWGTDGMLTPDVTDAAHYAYEMGFHAPTAEYLEAARAYAADPECTAERDAAIQGFFRSWELGVYARAVYYFNAAPAAMLAAESVVDDQERHVAFADALHELAEGLGLALGFYGVPDPSSGPMSGSGRVITDAHIEAIMDDLGVNLGDLNASTTGGFVEDIPAFTAGAVAAEAELEDAFGLSEAEVDAWHAENPG